MSELKTKLSEDMQSAMRSGDKFKLQTIRLILAGIKQQEVDTREVLTDQDVLAILTRMQKQRRESIAQFSQANRQDLVDKENEELQIITQYLPAALSEDEIDVLVQQALTDSGAESIKDMGKVMSLLKAKLAGRADMGKVSSIIKSKLSS